MIYFSISLAYHTPKQQNALEYSKISEYLAMSVVSLNRLEKKRILDFYMLCETFRKNGINSKEKAQESKDKLLKNAKIQVAVVAILSCIASLIVKQYAPTIFMFMTIAVVYICVFTYRGRNYIQRYIDEIISHPNFNPETGLIDDLEAEENKEETQEK